MSVRLALATSQRRVLLGGGREIVLRWKFVKFGSGGYRGSFDPETST